MDTGVKDKLSGMFSGQVQWNCSLKEYTTFSIGGRAQALVKVKDRNELQSLLRFVDEEGLLWRVIGRGSNLLVNDNGFPGIIIVLQGDFLQIKKRLAEDTENVAFLAGAGCSLGRLLKTCVDGGFTGLEFTVGIPGTVGGALIMNAGAGGEELGAVTGRVTLLTRNGTIELDKNELDFAYRSWRSFEKYRSKAVVIEAEFFLEKGDTRRIKALCQDLSERRKRTQPLEYPNAGSFFKNPEGDSAGRLIEASGCKGMNVGGAVVSEKHANFLVNCGDATASDVLKLMRQIQKKVKKDSGVQLLPEVHFL
jgi:UDP-N-acetylmuramate dehydrogenase